MKWSYKIELNDRKLELLGEQGWELVSVVMDGNKTKHYFKKPQPDFVEEMTISQKKEVYKKLGLEVSS